MEDRERMKRLGTQRQLTDDELQSCYLALVSARTQFKSMAALLTAFRSDHDDVINKAMVETFNKQEREFERIATLIRERQIVGADQLLAVQPTADGYTSCAYCGHRRDHPNHDLNEIGSHVFARVTRK